jgi:hypothetical protein
VKRRPRLLPCIPCVVALVGGTVGCGETTNRSPSPPSEGGGGNGTGAQGGSASGGSDGLDGGSAGIGEGSAGEATYAGAVLAMVTTSEATLAHVARAVFTAGPRPVIGGCPQCCCSSPQRGLPTPEKPPDAGEITLSPSAGAPPLATLTPEAFEGGHGTFHGMLDLGWSWFPPLSDYALAKSEPWKVGDALQVLARGNEVARFSEVLRTGPALEGVTPALGSAPVVVPSARSFTISWTPAAAGDATMLLGFPNESGICYCDAADSAGMLVVPADLVTPVSGEISLARLTISNVTNENASIDLVGAVVQRSAFEAR